MKSVEFECNLEAFQLFLQEEEKATNTIKSYLHAVKTYFQAHPDLTNQGVLAWKGELTRKYSTKTVNQRIIAIKKYASFCGVPISVKTIKEQRIFSNENVITDEQYHHLMHCLKSDEDWQWYYNILIIAKTGTRISEAIKLKKIDALNGFATLRTKGKVRTILFPLSLKEELSDYLATLGDYDYLLQSNKTKGDKSISKGAVNKALNFIQILRQRAKQNRYQAKEKKDFSGEVVNTDMYQYGVDYNLGDTVKIVNGYGIEGTATVTEITETEDSSGYRLIPTFSDWKVI